MRNTRVLRRMLVHVSSLNTLHLTSQGYIWKALLRLKTECWTLRNTGNKNILHYTKSLKTKKRNWETLMSSLVLRLPLKEPVPGGHHSSHGWNPPPPDILCWIETNWVQPDIFPTPRLTNKCCSLLCEWVNECLTYLPEDSRQRKSMEQLPALCVQMLLDGFPQGLVDGDSVNIPMKWITQVLNDLRCVMQASSKLHVWVLLPLKEPVPEGWSTPTKTSERSWVVAASWSATLRE